MAQRVNIVLVDDIDGTPATETVEFALDGISYEIDLSDDHVRQIRADLGSWADKARVVTRSAKRRGAAKRSARRNNSEIREWARANGYEVSERGRVPAEVKMAYEAAH